jgi:hypothetical protein
MTKSGTNTNQQDLAAEIFDILSATSSVCPGAIEQRQNSNPAGFAV